MGLCLLFLLHLLAVMVFPWALLITLPIHLLYGAICLLASDSRRCLECNEIASESAPLCRHCGSSTTSEIEDSDRRLTASTAFSGSSIAPNHPGFTNQSVRFWEREHEI